MYTIFTKSSKKLLSANLSHPCIFKSPLHFHILPTMKFNNIVVFIIKFMTLEWTFIFNLKFSNVPKLHLKISWVQFSIVWHDFEPVNHAFTLVLIVLVLGNAHVSLQCIMLLTEKVGCLRIQQHIIRVLAHGDVAMPSASAPYYAVYTVAMARFYFSCRYCCWLKHRLYCLLTSIVS